MSKRISIDLLLFGLLRDIVGKAHLEVEVRDACRAGEFLAIMTGKFPQLTNHKLFIAVNEEYADADTILNDGDEVALFTAVSGG